MSMFDRLRPRPTPKTDTVGSPMQSPAPESDTQRMKRRLAPTTIESRPVTGAQFAAFKEKLERQTDVIVQVDLVLTDFIQDLTRVERPDQYIATLGKALDRHHASPEVARGVIAACKKDLEDFYAAHAGTDTVLGLNGKYQTARKGTAAETKFVPVSFAENGRLDATGGLATLMDKWAEGWINGHAAKHGMSPEATSSSREAEA